MGSRRAGEGLGTRDGGTGPREWLQTGDLGGIWEGILPVRVGRGWDGIPREAVAASGCLEVAKAGLEPLGLVEGVPTHGWVSFESFPTQTVRR